MRSKPVLRNAWRAIQRNAQHSKSETTRKEVADFASDIDLKLARIYKQLRLKTFKFAPAKGVRIPKDSKNNSNFRPLVVAPIESRIVQRAVHDVLITVSQIKVYVQTLHSFGGVKKVNADDLAPVAAAIKAVLAAIESGGKFVIRSDITAFFTRILKSEVIKTIREAVHEEEFLEILESAIHVELANMAQLREHAQKFPIYDVGVAQGNSLSPLLGNIALFDFDKEMNKHADVRCIRYIDDFIIIAPNRDVAENLFAQAQSILKSLGMTLSLSKTSRAKITEPFEFLGIEFGNGFLRPSKESQERHLSSVEDAISKSVSAMRSRSREHPVPHPSSLVGTLTRLSGMNRGWGKHYYFCNDRNCLKRLDNEISKKIRRYLSIYREEREKADEADRWKLLGVEELGQMQLNPFAWPKCGK